MPEQRDPDRSRLRADRQAPGRHTETGGRRVQAHVRVGVQHAKAVRSDQPHPRVADNLQQPLLALVGLIALIGDFAPKHDQRLGPLRRRLARDLQHLLGRDGDHDELGRLLQLSDAAYDADRSDHTAGLVDRRGDTSEMAVDHV
jgi:hypothetical protein